MFTERQRWYDVENVIEESLYMYEYVPCWEILQLEKSGVYLYGHVCLEKYVNLIICLKKLLSFIIYLKK